MRRRKRFPVVSLCVLLGFGIAIGALTFYDRNVPSRALYQLGDAIAGAQRTLTLMLGGTPSVGTSPYYAAGGGIASGIPVLVRGDVPMPEASVPRNLVYMASYCDSSIVTIKDADIQGEKEAVDALMVMLSDAILQGTADWQISAGYRSVSGQQQVWDAYARDYETNYSMSPEQAQAATAKYVARPGYSEHHTGLAFDVTVPGESFPLTDQSRWLAENCWDYGFIIRYAEDKVAITGINAEPWHVRYVGKQHAKEMRENNWCLEEYLQAKGLYPGSTE